MIINYDRKTFIVQAMVYLYFCTKKNVKEVDQVNVNGVVVGGEAGGGGGGWERTQVGNGGIHFDLKYSVINKKNEKK